MYNICPYEIENVQVIANIIVETKSDENPKVHNTGHRVVGHG